MDDQLPTPNAQFPKRVAPTGSGQRSAWKLMVGSSKMTPTCRQRERDDLRSRRRTEKLPPPAATTTYWRPSLPRKVIGVRGAHAGELRFPRAACRSVDSKARKRQSIVAPMKMRPLAVAMLPPMFGVPVLSKPCAFERSKNPSGTFHAISPRLTSSATSSPNGGAEHGILVSGFQNRPTAPPHGSAAHPRRRSAAARRALHHLARPGRGSSRW